MSDLRAILLDPIAIIAASFLLDIAFGDPVYRLHPIRLIGLLLSGLERLLRRCRLNGYVGGVLLFVLLGGITVGIAEGVYLLLSRLHWFAGWGWYAFLGWNTIALRDLATHGRRVAQAVAIGDLAEARTRVGCLVGRDTDRMDLANCARAAIESLAENLTDGVIAPLFFLVLFGVPGALLFKVVSTMDSMVGYRNERYQRFGWCGARLDDVLNYLPARLTWLLIALVGALLPGFSGLDALRYGWRQHHLLPSPNSGWGEAAAAGALRRRLVGPIWRQGRCVVDLWIGNPDRPPAGTADDIERAILLNYATTLTFLLLAVLARWHTGWGGWWPSFPF